jgi:hypothetical protein
MRSELLSSVRSSTRAISSDELFSPMGQLAAQTRITPAASSWRTPPSRPRASARSRASACDFVVAKGVERLSVLPKNETCSEALELRGVCDDNLERNDEQRQLRRATAVEGFDPLT